MSPEDPRLAVGTDPPLRVLVAVPTPLQRALVGFFIQEAGFELLPIPLPDTDVVKLAAHDRPDAIVLHESIAVRGDTGLVRGVHRDSPSTKIAVLAQAPDEAWRGPARGADAYLEEWVGIAELDGVLRDLCRGGSTLLDATAGQAEASGLDRLPLVEDAVEEVPIPQAPAPTRSGRWYERLQGAAAAAIIVFALLRGPGLFLETVSTQGQSGGANPSLAAAYKSLDLLVYDLQQGSSSAVLIRDANHLRAARAAAAEAGADISGLDAAIASQVPSLLSTVPPDTASAVAAALGGLVDNPSRAPQPSPSASPSPNESPGPSPSPIASPTPSESVSPTATESPSESASPIGPSIQQAQGADSAGHGETPALPMTLFFAVLPTAWWLRIRSRNLF